jgi:hypothetical protein
MLGEDLSSMTRKLLFLVGLLSAFNVMALTNHELLKNLSSRLHDLPKGRGTLIKSFDSHSQSYIYDQALAIIAFTKEKDRLRAKKLLSALKHLQMQDGSLYFSYYLDGTSPYPIEGDKKIAGAMSWVALAATHYQHRFKSKEFLDFNTKLLTYLDSQIRPIEINGVKMRALSFAPNDIPSTGFPEQDTAALEHNLDAYAAFLHFTEINKTEMWKENTTHLKQFILSMWDKDKSHFWSGANFKTGFINKSELYLDNQSWTLLALDQATLTEISPHKAMDLNCEKFFVKHEGIQGFMDSRPVRYPASDEFVWSEGTLGQVLAMEKWGRISQSPMTCKEQKPSDFLLSIKQMKKEDGGIGYATTTANKDFTTSSSVAGTAWMYFAVNGFNPFHIEGFN